MLGIFNESVTRDEEGEYTYVGSNGDTVIDYMIGKEEIRERVRRLEVGDRIDSDHQPLMVYVEEKGTRKSGKAKEKEKRRYGTKGK